MPGTHNGFNSDLAAGCWVKNYELIEITSFITLPANKAKLLNRKPLTVLIHKL